MLGGVEAGKHIEATKLKRERSGGWHQSPRRIYCLSGGRFEAKPNRWKCCAARRPKGAVEACPKFASLAVVGQACL